MFFFSLLFFYRYVSKLVGFGVYDTLTCHGLYDWLNFIGLLVASQQRVEASSNIYAKPMTSRNVKCPEVEPKMIIMKNVLFSG